MDLDVSYVIFAICILFTPDFVHPNIQPAGGRDLFFGASPLISH